MTVSNSQEVIPSQELTKSCSTISQQSNVSNFSLEQTFPPKIDIITPELAAALDRANVSSRNATYILAATLKSVGIDINTVNLSHRTIHRSRILHRKDLAEGLKKDLKLSNNYVIHWDGKMLNDIITSNTVDRLPIVLTSTNGEQLLGVPKISSGSGIEQALAVYSTLEQWGVSNYIKAMCFDTASTNTGTLSLIL